MSWQTDLDNHANQLNPNNDAYWQSRGEDERGDDREQAVDQKDAGKKEGAEKHQQKPVG